MTPAFFVLKIMNLLVVFPFDCEPKKCFQIQTARGLYGGEWEGRECNLCTFQPFLLY